MTKVCRQCGVIKPTEQFRNYYGGRKGTYTLCKSCEKINSRLKYLAKKEDLSDTEQAELSRILELYETQRKLGLKPPSTGVKEVSVSTSVESLMNMYKPTVESLSDISTDDVPIELAKWLTHPLNDTPEFYMDVYEKLVNTYSPIINIDPEKLVPVRDKTYSKILYQILERMCDYEDTYYSS